jgi:aryl-alcohol dehydrogenase-like predicted oxidoreductase
MEPRTLGSSGVQVSAMGMGCWAIGGPWLMRGQPAGWLISGLRSDAKAWGRR